MLILCLGELGGDAKLEMIKNQPSPKRRLYCGNAAWVDFFICKIIFAKHLILFFMGGIILSLIVSGPLHHLS